MSASDKADHVTLHITSGVLGTVLKQVSPHPRSGTFGFLVGVLELGVVNIRLAVYGIESGCCRGGGHVLSGGDRQCVNGNQDRKPCRELTQLSV
jgi:hypothetical protein